jgi:streptogramin lyase
MVRVRPAPEVEITFDSVTTGGSTSARVIEFLDDRVTPVDKDLRDFFPAGSPERALLPSVIIPSHVRALGKGGPGGPPTFVLAIVDTDAVFSRTAEFHGLEEFRLGWHPPCVVNADPTQEPRTFYAREPAKNEPDLVEESPYEGPVFVDISSGCGSNKGSGWNFSLYLTGRDARPPLEVARFMLQRMQDALSSLGLFITNPTVAGQLLAEVQAALASLDAAPASALVNVSNWIALVDGNPAAFDNAIRNVSGELVGRGQSARYMIGKLLPTGTIVEFSLPVANSWPFGIAAGPDGNLWFAETFGPRIGRITPAGVETEFGPTGGQPVGITEGPDGNLWYAEHTGQRIGRITPAGVITTFPDPSTSNPYGIAAGPDGNLWFTGRLGAVIGRVTPAGALTTFNTSSVPSWIASGPDGNLWFTLIDANRIGRITPSGTITEFTIPTANSRPQGITSGPDGNLWFVESQGNKVGRITPSGVITEFPIPTASSLPWGITAGPDGNLWFTEQNGNRIGRITPVGGIVEFPIPTANSRPYEITTGPDGNLWFTQEGTNKIGRISP